MKRIFSFLLILALSVLSLLAQPSKRIYLFPEFTTGHIEFTNRSKADIRMNFDAAGQTIYYYSGDVLMEMTNLPMIRTLQVGDRVFVVREGLLCEVFDNESGPVLVNWKFKNVNKGSKGALGFATQGKVEVITSLDYGQMTYSPSNPGKLEGKGAHALEIWEQKNDNTYFLTLDGVEYKVKTLKDLYRAFPDRAAALKAYAKANHLMMTTAEDAFKVIDYLHTLK